MTKILKYLQGIVGIVLAFVVLGTAVGFFAGVTWWFAKAAFLLFN
jgi:hypothetical protein